MNKYEMLTIFNASLTDEEKENIVKKYSDMMASNGGNLLTVNKWGVKKLAYAINFKKEGYYVLFEFENSAEVPAKVTALMNIDENVLRSLCLKKDEKEAK
jgi:small subunit ribosomal protein S6